MKDRDLLSACKELLANVGLEWYTQQFSTPPGPSSTGIIDEIRKHELIERGKMAFYKFKRAVEYADGLLDEVGK